MQLVEQLNFSLLTTSVIFAAIYSLLYALAKNWTKRLDNNYLVRFCLFVFLLQLVNW